MKQIKIGIVLDSLESINLKKDTTLAIMIQAQTRNWHVYVMQQNNLSIVDSKAYGFIKRIEINLNQSPWYKILEEKLAPLTDLDIIFMRKDPPFNMNYIHSTYVLELAEKAGVLVVNKPQSLRDANEKAFIVNFPHCIAPTIFAMDKQLIKDFINENKKVVLKPLDSMGGQSIFMVNDNDPNINVIIEVLTKDNAEMITAQKFIPDIVKGDKRILLINGDPIPYGLARIPPKDDARANLAVGGRGEVFELGKRDLWLCEQVGPTLKQKGLIFAGIDVIGDYITEINVTSPTCIREIEAERKINIAGKLLDEVYLLSSNSISPCRSD